MKRYKNTWELYIIVAIFFSGIDKVRIGEMLFCKRKWWYICLGKLQIFYNILWLALDV